MKRGGPLRRGTPLRRRTPLRWRSAKREGERDARWAVTIRVLERDRTCRAGPRLRGHDGAPKCGVVIQDVHEIKTRGRGGDYLDPDNCIGVCRPCHRWITEHPEAAQELGLVKHSWEE